ncbi:hypothetical protein RCL_jg12052.t1 [Rhizophagus clarus]|uniref:Uncharacterized protein n=1 Tax=Rhizophagus clarus TaxID=94130 RepID=A0A8H3L6Z2_9GLOM|nr:hypothetical protein RCL_jg12052.t1 [Rhizophagus clarus]
MRMLGILLFDKNFGALGLKTIDKRGHHHAVILNLRIWNVFHFSTFPHLTNLIIRFDIRTSRELCVSCLICLGVVRWIIIKLKREGLKI